MCSIGLPYLGLQRINGARHQLKRLGEQVVEKPNEDAGVVTGQLAEVEIAQRTKKDLEEGRREGLLNITAKRSSTCRDRAACTAAHGTWRRAPAGDALLVATWFRQALLTLSSVSSGAPRFIDPATYSVVLMARSFQS